MANETPTTNSKQQNPPAFRWIINNSSGVRVIPAPATSSTVSKTTMHDAQPLVLNTGANLVDGRKWAALRAAEEAAAKKAKENGFEAANEIERLLTTKIEPATHSKRPVENVGAFYLVEGPGVTSKSDPLAGIDEAKALEIIRELSELNMVRQILQVEKRPGVAEALVKRRDQLTRGLGAVA